MSAKLTLWSVCLASLLAGSNAAWSGGVGGHGVMIPPGGGFHGGGGFRSGAFYGAGGGFHGGWGRPGGVHPLPPVAGVIHERGGQSFMTSYGHTNTGFAGSGYHRGGIYDVGHGQAGGYGQQQRWAGYGQQQTWGGGRQQGGGYGRERFWREGHDQHFAFRERRYAEFRHGGRYAYGSSGYGGYGGYGGVGYGSGSTDSGDIGSYPAAGTYGSAGTSLSAGDEASAGTYGSAGIYPAPGVYESELNGSGFSYRSETPLSARYAEAPLAPSPYGGFDAGNSYADAASRDVGPGYGPRIIHVSQQTSSCTCDRSVRSTPMVYRYGVGTAY